MSLKTGFTDEMNYNKSYALVVGISKYASIRWKNLPYARSDAEKVAEILKQKGFEVLTLFDRNATRLAILARLEQNIAPRLQPNDRVLFYFSGHGYSKQDGEVLNTYLIPYDKESIDVNVNHIYVSMSDLERQSKMMSIAKHQLFIIDAPIQAIDQSSGSGIMLTNPDYLTMVTQKKARQLLVAGKNKKIPEKSNDMVHNVLSKLFVKGLHKGRADINGDGSITCLELCSFIMPRATNVGQKPDYATFSDHEMGEFLFYSPKSIRKQIAEEAQELEIEDLTVEKKAAPIVDIQEGRLYIKTKPEGAKIRILNIVPPYRYGMMLSPGNYKIEVSKTGYQTKIQWISIANQDRLHETIELKSTRPYSQLFINPEPSDARIRLMNIVPPYSHGMALQAGQYLIEVDKPGYKTYKKWVTIAKGKDCVIAPVLQSKTPKVKPQNNMYQVRRKSVDIKESTLQPEKQKMIHKKDNKKTSHKQPKGQIPKVKEKNLVSEAPPKIPPKQEIQPKTQPKPQKPLKQKSQEKEQVVASLHKPNTHPQKPTDQKQWQDKTTGMVFVHIKGGCYEMGCGEWTGQCDPDELPVHKVCVDDFWMGQYEVTQKEWQIIMEKNPSMSAYGSHYPVEKVSWEDVQTFIKKLEKKSNQNFRLPTEAEWEFACRSGGKNQKYAGRSLDINHLGWFKDNSMYITHGVGIKAPNSLGLYDMSGNVSEWCMDAYQTEAYKKHHKNKPQVKHGNIKVVRGGDWSDKYNHLRCADRRGYAKNLRSKDIGFRLIVSFR
jgi:formylglycine-generating enzyme required for sulfatase activity